MLQNTKAWRIPSSRVKTGTTQKRNLSLAVSQAERAPECQEQAWKGGGLSSIKELFSPQQPCGGKQRAVREACGIGMLPEFFKGQLGAAVRPHTHRPPCPVLLHRQWVCSPKKQNTFDLQFFSLLFSLNYT